MSLIEYLIVQHTAKSLVVYRGDFYQPCRVCWTARAVVHLIECLIVQHLANCLVVVYRGRFPSAMPRMLDSTRSNESHRDLIVQHLANCLVVVYRGRFHQPCSVCYPARAVVSLIKYPFVRQLANSLVVYRGLFP